MHISTHERPKWSVSRYKHWFNEVDEERGEEEHRKCVLARMHARSRVHTHSITSARTCACAYTPVIPPSIHQDHRTDAARPFSCSE